jgi:hypothetical protein
MTKAQRTSLLRVYSKPLGLYHVAKSYRELMGLGLVKEVRPNRWLITKRGERVAERERV